MKRVIVCGFGFMGQNHAANIFLHPDLELAAVVDSRPRTEIKPVKGNITTAELDWNHLNRIPFYPTLSEALEQCPADAVLIASPTAFHVPLSLEAIKHDKHVFVEKPLCFSLEEAALVQAALTGKNLVFQVGHCVRFLQEYKLLASAVRKNQYGKLKSLKLTRMTGTPNWGVWKDLQISLTATAGPLFDLNIHDIDYALSLTGEPDEMTVQTRPGSETMFQSLWQYRNGTAVQIEGGFIKPSTLPFRSGFTAVFEHAVMEYDSRFGNKIMLSAETGFTEINTETERSNYYDEIAEFASAMETGAPVQCNAEEAIRTVRSCCRLKSLLASKNESPQ